APLTGRNFELTPTTHRGRGMVARLVFLNGARAGAAMNLGDAPVTIGRRPNRSVVYSEDDTMVSADHATIEHVGHEYILRDEGSRNGTLVNAQPISRQVLSHGDLIQFGEGGPAARFLIEGAAG